uniref:UBN2 domain-containing protein n=1 Tax=Anopheles quadriannulatus TaxID=34691 RepID=A0A182X4U5_ANOQN
MELKLTKEKLMKTVKEPKPTEEKEMASWYEKDGEARHMIGLAVENDELIHICRKTTAKEMWDTLMSIHE